MAMEFQLFLLSTRCLWSLDIFAGPAVTVDTPQVLVEEASSPPRMLLKVEV
jgi:hypothetical protein